jgi:hypothetical protein
MVLMHSLPSCAFMQGGIHAGPTVVYVIAGTSDADNLFTCHCSFAPVSHKKRVLQDFTLTLAGAGCLNASCRCLRMLLFGFQSPD